MSKCKACGNLWEDEFFSILVIYAEGDEQRLGHNSNEVRVCNDCRNHLWFKYFM